MKVNILTITPLVLTALLVTGRTVNAISDDVARGHLAIFSTLLGREKLRSAGLDGVATEILYSKETAQRMLEVASHVRNKAPDEEANGEIDGISDSEFWPEFLKDLEEIISKDDGISKREAEISLFYYAKVLSHDHSGEYHLNNEVLNRLESWQMAEEMLKIIKDVEENPIKGSGEDMITEFLGTDRGRTFQEGLTRTITNKEDNFFSKLLARSNFRTTARKVTLTVLYFIHNDKGAHLFSKDDILAAIRFLKRATNPSVSTQA
ncbi:hypothetical protein IWQ61_006269 [Dispira simplex]|nr:hypothetical protein IWQ61_006269 [Dispira simplex]